VINFITSFYYFFFFILGAIVGSFLNVVALRYNTGKSIALSRSACFHCSKRLAWYELIPLLSFIIQKGKCLNCRSKISPQYFLVEIVAGIVFALIAHMFGNFNSESIFFDLTLIIYYCVVFSILIVIFIYDLRHMIIPDPLAFLFAFLALGKLLSDHGSLLFHMPGILWLLAGPILAFPFAFLWLISKGTWIGLGDAKLTLGIGWLLGLTGGLTAVVFAFWIGAAASVFLMMIKKNTKSSLSMKSEVPFGPYLIIGLTIVFFTNFDLIDFLLGGSY
jgi:prepilin signal peptidase PulO-like enzyme (type II secretory pathway)